MSDCVSKTVLVRQALTALGDNVPHQELAVFIEQRHGVKIDVKVIPILRASVRELEYLEKAREAAKLVVEKARAEQPTGGKGRRRVAGRGQLDPVTPQGPSPA